MKIGLIAAAFAVCATAASAQTLTVASEEGVTYTVISLSNDNGTQSITMRRDEGNANTYSEHDVSCDPYRIGLVATGPTLESLAANALGEYPMEEIIRGSSEDAIAGYACDN